ncbi:MAG: hypothetical protein ACRDZZ_14170 [Ilumatobacteraceae bacterium]
MNAIDASPVDVAGPVAQLPDGSIGASLGSLVFQAGHMGARLGWHGPGAMYGEHGAVRSGEHVLETCS